MSDAERVEVPVAVSDGGEQQVTTEVKLGPEQLKAYRDKVTELDGRAYRLGIRGERGEDTLDYEVSSLGLVHRRKIGENQSELSQSVIDHNSGKITVRKSLVVPKINGGSGFKVHAVTVEIPRENMGRPRVFMADFEDTDYRVAISRTVVEMGDAEAQVALDTVLADLEEQVTMREQNTTEAIAAKFSMILNPTAESPEK